MREVIRLIQDIRAFLSGAAGSPPAEALAQRYAQWREDVGRRLEACAAMLAKGSEYQVLQLAETEPPLLELVGQLNFPEEPQWIEHCRTHELPVPERLDEQTLQQLQAIYSKGISSNSPMYRDYRAAVLARNDIQALKIVRSLVRLNPGDTNARQEMARLENKQMLAVIDEIKAALARGDEEVIPALMDQAEAHGSDDKLMRQDAYVQALEVRRKIRRAAAEKQAHALLGAIADLRAARDWKAAGSKIANVRLLERDFSLSFTPEEITGLESAEKYVQAERAEAAEQAKFQASLGRLNALVDELDTRLLTAATLTLKDAERREATFADLWKEVERYGRPVPASQLSRIQGVGSAIRAEAQRLRKANKAQQMVLACVVLVITAAGAWVGYVAWRAHQYVQQLDDLRERNLAAGARSLIAAIPTSAPWGATSIPSLRSKMAEVAQWARNEDAHLSSTGDLLAELETAAQSDFRNLSPRTIQDKLVQAKEAVNGVAADQLAQSKDRLSQMDNRVNEYLTNLQQKNNQAAQARAKQLQDEVAKLNFETPAATLSQQVAALEPELKSLEQLIPGEVPDLHLSADVEGQIKKLRARFTPFAEEIATWQSAKAGIAAANDLPGYEDALKKYASLPHLVEVGEAAAILAKFPRPDALAAQLLFQGDSSAWEAAKADTEWTARLHPADVGTEERNEILNLRDDPMLNDVWEVTATKRGGGEHKLFSKGKPEQAANDANTYHGEFYDPQLSPKAGVFISESYAKKDSGTETKTQLVSQFGTGSVTMTTTRTTGSIESFRPSAARVFMDSLDIGHVMDSSGEHFERSLLGYLDRVVHENSVNPLLRAYVMRKIQRVMLLRPLKWGLQYCSRVSQDLDEIDHILNGQSLRAQDWMVPEQQEKFQKKLDELFKRISTEQPYFDAALAYRGLVTSVREAGIGYAGYLDGQFNLHLKGVALGSAEVWAESADGETPVLIPLKDGHAQDPATLQKLRIWSPLFVVPVDRQKFVAKLRNPSTNDPAHARPSFNPFLEAK